MWSIRTAGLRIAGGFPISVDLGAHSGFKWSLFYHPRLLLWRIVLNTSAANPAGTEHAGDMPLWGEPRLLGDGEATARPVRRP